ncbi:MAG TPA: peptide chain release factor 1 [Acetobacteraceae bacterium]|nr:peptide chain release factor 1 [Acetobacteraceae bacterium]
MTETDYQYKLAELDRLLNDPDVPMEPTRIWSLLAEVSRHDNVVRRGATREA